MKFRFLAICILVFLFAVLRLSLVSAITIDVDFQSGTLFSASADAQAKGTILAAARDLSAAITSSLNAVPTDRYTATNGSASALFNFHADYDDPVTNQVFPFPSAILAADTVKIFVGTSNLGGNTLGLAGPHIGVGEDSTVDYDPLYPEEWVGAVTAAAAQASAAYTRGGGPLIGTLAPQNPVIIGGVAGTYSIDYGVAFGSVWFDVDENNNGYKDDAATLDDYWHWRSDTSVPSGEFDLYSVALHEMIHVLGVGTSLTWDSQVSGTSWTGSDVYSAHGSGVNVVAGDGIHIAPNVKSPRVADGIMQETVMAPYLAAGIHKELTVLDLAFLRDLGFETITPVIPDPPDFDGDGDVDGDDLVFITDSFGVDRAGDANNDGLTTGDDFLVWQRQYTEPLASTIAQIVPEPSSLALLASAMALLGVRFRSSRPRLL